MSEHRDPDGPDAPKITDGVVTLNGFALDDVAAQVAGEDDEHARRFGWYPEHSTPATVRRIVERWQHEWRHEGPVRAFAIRAGDELVGGVELRMVGSDAGEVSYWTFPSHRRRGLAARAVRLACEFGFEALRLQHIEAHIEPSKYRIDGCSSGSGFPTRRHRARDHRSGRRTQNDPAEAEPAQMSETRRHQPSRGAAPISRRISRRSQSTGFDATPRPGTIKLSPRGPNDCSSVGGGT